MSNLHVYINTTTTIIAIINEEKRKKSNKKKSNFKRKSDSIFDYDWFWLETNWNNNRKSERSETRDQRTRAPINDEIIKNGQEFDVTKLLKICTKIKSNRQKSTKKGRFENVKKYL